MVYDWNQGLLSAFLPHFRAIVSFLPLPIGLSVLVSLPTSINLRRKTALQHIRSSAFFVNTEHHDRRRWNATPQIDHIGFVGARVS
jgi:hypothetical protein